ncbi:hypothetical protein GAS19_25935 [Burkholderia glumae]|nr:hypothetical protein [Burkholderia glumae]QGA40881.1 hypothetical protein GAS19_25935 [Burkholderia glumae]
MTVLVMVRTAKHTETWLIRYFQRQTGRSTVSVKLRATLRRGGASFARDEPGKSQNEEHCRLHQPHRHINMDPRFNAALYDPAAYADLQRRMNEMQVGQSPQHHNQSPQPGSEPPRARQSLPRPDGMPEARRARRSANADGRTRYRADLPASSQSGAARGRPRGPGEASSSAQFAPPSPVLTNRTHRPLLPTSDFRGFEGFSNIVGAMYEKPSAAYGLPRDVKYGQLAEPMVRCSDGMVRRYPRSDDVSHNYISQVESGLIYDVPADRVTNRIGGFSLSGDGSQVAFEVDGYPVSPIKVGSQFQAYPLPNGKVLVPQPGFRDCTNACELMMMFDHGHVGFHNADRYQAENLGSRRELSHIMASLQRKTGCTPVLVEHDISYKKGTFGASHPSRKQAWRDLAKKINEMGPCILSKGGHVVMLDGIREAGGKFHLTIREPFHATCLEFRDTEKFFTDQFRTPERVHLEAIFLKRPA